MPINATFGSFGDIVSLCIIVKDLVKALDRSRGSSAEYRAIITELWVLDDILVQVELLWGGCVPSEEFDVLRATAH